MLTGAKNAPDDPVLVNATVHFVVDRSYGSYTTCYVLVSADVVGCVHVPELY